MNLKKVLAVVLLTIFLVSATIPQNNLKAAEGNWRRIADMHEERGRGPAGAVLPNGNFLVIGGASGGTTSQITNTVEMYDLSRDRWEYKAPMNQRRMEIEAVTLDDGRILVPGGRISFSPDPKPRVTDTVEVYNSNTDTWSYVASMNTRRRNYRMVKLNDGRVLVAGGRNDEVRTIRSMEIYDPKKDQWEYVADMPYPIFSPAMSILPDGRVLVAGGADGAAEDEEFYDKSIIYDPETNKWSDAAHLSQPRAAVKAGLLRDGRVVVVGGVLHGEYLNDVEAYRPQDDSWTTVDRLTSLRRLPAFGVLPNGDIIVAGGRSGDDKELKTAEIGHFNHAPVITLTSPADDYIINANNNSITLKWSASDLEGDRITEYRLKIGTSPGDSNVLNTSGSWTTSRTFNFSSRSPNQTYYWTVMARDEQGDWSDWAPTRSFTVRNRDPAAYFRFSPSKTDRLHNVSFINSSSDPDGDSLTFEWDYRMQGTSEWTRFSTDAEPKYTFPDVGKYDLRLTATDPYGASHAYTRSDLEIYNLAPTIEAISPTSGHVTEIGQTTVNLKWKVNDPEGDPMNRYELKIGTTSGGNEVLETSGSWRTSYTFNFSDRNPNQTYYWSVRGRDVHGDWSSWSPVQSFKVPKQLDASVEHAPRWEEERIKVGRSEDEFLAGEPFLIVAETSDQAVEVTAESPFNIGFNKVNLTHQGGKWHGVFYDAGYENIAPGSYSFTVTARYDNGYEESVDLSVTVKGKLNVRVNRTY